jgi:hypothetical protein
MMQPGSHGLNRRSTAACEGKESLLRHILSQRRISCDTAGSGMNHARMTCNQHLKRLGIAVAMVAGEEVKISFHEGDGAAQTTAHLLCHRPLWVYAEIIRVGVNQLFGFSQSVASCFTVTRP